MQRSATGMAWLRASQAKNGCENIGEYTIKNLFTMKNMNAMNKKTIKSTI